MPDDYRFVAEDGSDVSLSDLFGDHDTLSSTATCSARSARRRVRCAHRSWVGSTTRSPTSRQRVAIAFTARSPIERLIDAKASRGWTDLPVYSDAQRRLHEGLRVG